MAPCCIASSTSDCIFTICCCVARLKLLWPHEAKALETQYRRLEVREEEWILRSRGLPLSQISLYLGAVLLFCGAMLYYIAYLSEAVDGIAGPLVFLALPFAGINLIARRLYQGERQSVAVAFHLASVLLLPLFLLTALNGSIGRNQRFRRSMPILRLTSTDRLRVLWRARNRAP